MKTIARIHNESEYNEILRQAVAVIETARGNAARAIVSTQNEMLFFHRGLRALVAVDLKISEFMPEYISKMNLYLSLLDRPERGKDENPSIGIILCAEKDNVEVELALEGFTKPIGVAEYKLIVPQKELKQLITDEIKTFNKEIADKQ